MTRFTEKQLKTELRDVKNSLGSLKNIRSIYANTVCFNGLNFKEAMDLFDKQIKQCENRIRVINGILEAVK